MTLLAVATLCGIYTGLSRQVLALVPLMLLLVLAHAIASHEQGPLSWLLETGVQIIALQCGYMLGLTYRSMSRRPASLLPNGPTNKSGDHAEWI